MTKVVFADIDGVLATIHTRPRGSLDPALVARLDRLCREAGAVVVVSSSWRARGLDWLRSMFRVAGFTGEIVGLTPIGAAWPDTPRGDEIGAWMVMHGQPEVYAILDDDNDMGVHTPSLVRTRATVGLSEADVAAALALLGGVAPQDAQDAQDAPWRNERGMGDV